MVTVGTNIVDNVYEPFPEGTYMGVFTDCGVVKNQDGSWAGLELTFTDVEPVGDFPEDGRPFSDVVTIRVNNKSILDVDDFSSLPRELFALRLGAGHLAGLAEAFGAAERGEEGVTFDMEDFIEGLQEGRYAGGQATFTTRQRERTYTDKEGNERKATDTNATRYFPIG